MCKLSNFTIFVLNLLTVIISLGLIIGTIQTNKISDCEKYLRTPLLLFGSFLFLISLLGLIGACSRLAIFLWIYIFVMFVMIVALFCFTIFTIVVTNKGVGQAVSGKGFEEYRLGDYSNWLQKHVVSGNNWETIRSCLANGVFCSDIGHSSAPNQIVLRNISPIQSGCCKPPMYCGFTFVNATVWNVPKTGPAVPDLDCTTWSNHQDTLCYDCNSCKAGILASLKNDWTFYTKINIAVLILLLIIYSIACCAFKNNRNDHYKRYRGF